MASCWRPKLGHPWSYPPKWEKSCPRSGRTAVQNFTPIGKVSAEKFVTVHKKKKETHSKLSIPPYRPTAYGVINYLHSICSAVMRRRYQRKLDPLRVIIFHTVSQSVKTTRCS